jgi:HAE1 family hydrophobic/amphiphilic exporter-1
MNICEPFIRRPIATTLLMLAIALFGVLAYVALPVNDLPNVDFPAIQVSAALPGADPETMSSAVATPLERQFASIPGLNEVNSANSFGSTQMNLQFDLNRDIDAAGQDVQAAINQAARLLPPGMPTPPSVRKINPSLQGIMSMDLRSSTLPLSVMTHYAETVVSPQLSMINGVASTGLTLDRKYAVRVQLDPGQLAINKIGINEVENALSNWNVHLPVGGLQGERQNLTLKMNGQLMEAAAYRSLIVAYRNGSPVRLEDLGKVLDDVEDNKTARWYGDSNELTNAIIMPIQRQPGANSIQVRDAVAKAIANVKAQIPPSLELSIVRDNTLTIRGSFQDIQVTLALALALVILVIFLFLRHASATLIPSLALPFSIIGTLAVIYLLDFSLNNLSLMALLLAVGFVVDDAIVMLENIMRHIEMGEEPFEAALNGSKEIGFTIVSMTLSLAAVFIPVLFMGGILGRLFREFGVTICAAVLISGIVSLTLTPMLASRLLRSRGEQKDGWFYRVTEGVFNSMVGLYDRTLQGVLRHRAATLAISAVILVATVFLFIKIPKGFVPDEDTNELTINVEGDQGTSFPKMEEHSRAIANVLRKDPNVRNFTISISSNSNTGWISLHLIPRAERKMDVGQIVQQYRSKLSFLPGMRVFTRIPPAITVGTQQGKALFLFTLQSSDTEELFREAPAFEQKMARLPAIQDISSDLQIRNPELRVSLDRDKAAALKLTAQDIENALSDAYSSRWVSTIYAADSEYKVLLELKPEYQADPSALSLLYIKSSDGHLVPLSTVTKLARNVGAQQINHYGQLPAVSLSFNLKPGVALGDAVAQIQDLAAKTLPPSITTTFQGSAKTFQSSQKNLLFLLILAILIIYIVLGILYESYIHPITILSGLPSAGFGALLTLMLFHIDLNIYSFVGLIMLVGIVKKNAIMQIDFALEAERKEGKSPLEAIYQGCLIRFRPIMMTTMAALLGALPIAYGYGQGGEARRPLGLTVVGGLLFSQLITLYLTPVVYTYLAAFQTRFQKHAAREKAAQESHRPPVPA